MKNLFTRGICVVGVGRWGSTLQAALQKQGLALRSQDEVAKGKGEVELYWLCVPDAQIRTATRTLVQRLVQRRVSLHNITFLHSSGAYSSDLLSDAEKAGARIGSVHPLMTFPTRRPVALEHVPFAVEAEAGLRRKLFRLVRMIGGKPFAVAPEGKQLYHAAAVLASPLLVALVTAAEETARLSGLSSSAAKALLAPIMTRTLQNCFSVGPAFSFSGPFARGEEETVSLHLEALRAHPLLSQVYLSLAAQALATLPGSDYAALDKTLQRARFKPVSKGTNR